MKTAILGTDLSVASDRVIENSAQLRLFGVTKIVLVNVLNLRTYEDFAEYDMDSSKAKIDEQKNQLAAMGFEAETRVVMGVPAAELMRQAKILGAEMVVLGSRGHTWHKATLGETASEVLHNMKYPVLLMVFKNDPPAPQPSGIQPEEIHKFEKFVRMFRKQEPKIELASKTLNEHILLTTDFSDFSENAFSFLKKQITPVPRLTLMHVQDVVKISKHLEDKLAEFNQIDTARMEKLRDDFRKVHPETEISIALDYGIPKELIPKYIKENKVTLTVMGSQGRGYIGEFFLGSVSLRVARQAESNVIIVPFHKKI